MSVSEPSDEVNAGMAKQTEGRRLALSRKCPPSVKSLVVGWLVVLLVGWLLACLLAWLVGWLVGRLLG